MTRRLSRNTMITAETIAGYIINSPMLMLENREYYAYWNTTDGLNYFGNLKPDNIIISVECPYLNDKISREEFDNKESLSDSDFMIICEKLADCLNREIERYVDK